nr:ergothioneine biosynthesis protein EgtB [uncultured Rhodopila sp.]
MIAVANELPARYQSVRRDTETLVGNLTEEDQSVQSMPDASPAKWHRAHTTWFFEQFVLVPHISGYRVFDPAFSFLFNSYYDAVGDRHPRPSRGLLTRPPVRQVTEYRRYVDAAMRRALPGLPASVLPIVELGLQHEQQHQELLMTDLLHAFAANPLCPAVLPDWREPEGDPAETAFIRFPAGLHRIGHDGRGFCFDNETPSHRVWLDDFSIASRLVRNRDWLAFIEDGGYRTPPLWMSDGWAAAQAGGWDSPLYWRKHDGRWFQFGPGGLVSLAMNAPVRHVSWYEADAFARWSGARLPTEAEWEIAGSNPEMREQYGHVWQWTESAYRPYPGYRPEKGAIGEYNGKFMINQMVLRGGASATPRGHARPTYRNFFHPDKRWQFAGLRLARNV